LVKNYQKETERKKKRLGACRQHREQRNAQQDRQYCCRNDKELTQPVIAYQLPARLALVRAEVVQPE